MKRFLYLTVCFFILGKFYGCNGDVFVDDFRSSDSELTLDGNGDVATIQFAAANWDWMYIAFDFPIQYKIYDHIFYIEWENRRLYTSNPNWQLQIE